MRTKLRLSALLATLIFFSASVAAAPGANYHFAKGVNISHWLAQHTEAGEKYASDFRFNERDAAWIKQKGFDHLRIPVDGRILINIEGKPIGELLAPFDSALNWAQAHKLGVILDMHYLPGAEFLKSSSENKLWTSPALQAAAANLWRAIAERYQAYGDILRFEVLNEAVAPTPEHLNLLNKKLVAAVREVSPDRIIYLSSNKHGSFTTAEHVEVLDDPNIHYTFHYYLPMLFTHQNAPWAPHYAYYRESVAFPSTLTNLDKVMPKGAEELKMNNVSMDEAYVAAHFDQLAKWAKKNKAEILISEFGAITKADPESTKNWIAAVRRACDKHGFGWTVWDYKGDFAVRDKHGETAVWEGLFSAP